jgi:hypothetical protein
MVMHCYPKKTYYVATGFWKNTRGGGFRQEYAYLFTKLFDRVYTSGYNEGKWSGQQEQYLVNLGSQIYSRS